MRKRVFVNEYGIITLDSDLFGKRKRLTTGKKIDPRWIKFYETNFDREYTKLYEEKNGKVYSNMPTFKEYGGIVIELGHSDRTPETIIEVNGKFERLCNYFGEKRLDEIKSLDVKKWQSGLNYSPKTIMNYRAYLNIIFQSAVDDDILTKNPLKSVKSPKKKRVIAPVYLSGDELALIVSKAKGKYKNALQVLSFTGMRGGELIALKWKNIDFKNKVIKVCENRRDGRDKDPKNGETRYVPMSNSVFDALKAQQLETGIFNNYVFLNQYNKPYRNQDVFNRVLKEICLNLNLEIATLHDLRRSLNTLLKQSGYQSDFILQMIGNTKDVNIEHYTGKLDADMSKLDKFVV